MRAFLATPCPATPPLRALLKDLRGAGPALKVVGDENLHVTYKFLGEIEPERAPLIVATIKDAGLPPAFELGIRDVGAFPDWRRLNVLWAGLDDADGLMTKLAAAVEEATAGLGWSREDRPFRPHVTLARRRGGPKDVGGARRVLEAARGRHLGTCRVEAVHLYRSDLTADGPVYETVGKVGL